MIIDTVVGRSNTTYTRFTCQKEELIQAGMFANKRRWARWGCQAVGRGAAPAGRSQPEPLGPQRRGFPLPCTSSKPIVSQLTCGCVGNKPLSWLWRACFLGPAPPPFKHPQRTECALPFPPSLGQKHSLGQRGPRGKASIPESRSTAPSHQHSLDPYVSFLRVTQERHSGQALKPPLGNFQQVSEPLLAGAERVVQIRGRIRITWWGPFSLPKRDT